MPDGFSSLGGDELRDLVRGLTVEELADLVSSLPLPMAEALVQELDSAEDLGARPANPIQMATKLYDSFETRPHLTHLSDVIAQAVEDVENGHNRSIIVEMPPRTGKTTLATMSTVGWTLSRHPEWPHAMLSHDSSLANQWGRQVRRWTSGGKLGAHIGVAPDAGAVGEWQTTEEGWVYSLSVRESFTGRGAKVLMIDDPHKDFIDAHSKTMRDNVWDWWLSVAQTRLQAPSLVVVTMTRWHEDDFVGRLLSKEYPGDPSEWIRVRLPAIAEEDDVLGRAPGEPLYTPLLKETREEAIARWARVRATVGEHVWSSMYQQRPSPAKGAIYDMDAFRFWTSDPERVTYGADGEPDGRVVLLNPAEDLPGARWLDSWDMSFKAKESNDYTVGQRWARLDARRYLICQKRGRWGFTKALDEVRKWSSGEDLPILNPYGNFSHQRLVEDTANGPAVIDTLQDKVAGIKPISPKGPKEMRARAVTPEIESGHVYLPHPSDPGNEWVGDLLSELRNFPNDKHDDQVDALNQALLELRGSGKGMVTVPGRAAGTNPFNGPSAPRSIIRAAQTDGRRYGSGGGAAAARRRIPGR